MRKLIWQLYNDNMISIEVAHMLLDKYYVSAQLKKKCTVTKRIADSNL